MTLAKDFAKDWPLTGRKSECVIRTYDCPDCGQQEHWSKWSGWTPCACPGEPRRIKPEGAA